MLNCAKLRTVPVVAMVAVVTRLVTGGDSGGARPGPFGGPGTAGFGGGAPGGPGGFGR